MAKFPIQQARQELGFTPSTGVRANIDVRQGDVGGAIGQALVAGARELQRGSVRRAALEERNRNNLDSLSAKESSEIGREMVVAITTMKINTPPEQWEPETEKIVTQFNQRRLALDLSPDALAEQRIQEHSRQWQFVLKRQCGISLGTRRYRHRH